MLHVRYSSRTILVGALGLEWDMCVSRSLRRSPGGRMRGCVCRWATVAPVRGAPASAVPARLFACPCRKGLPMSRASKTLVEFAEQMARVAPAVEPFGSIRERPHARRVPLSGVRACAVALPQRHAPRRHLSGVRQTCRDPAPCAGPRAAGTLRPRLLSSRRAVSQPVSR